MPQIIIHYTGQLDAEVNMTTLCRQMADAMLTGVETRTSSPLRIQRDDDYESPGMRGLYPAGEGAGYAGGILSAGVDGIKVGEAVARMWAERNPG